MVEYNINQTIEDVNQEHITSLIEAFNKFIEEYDLKNLTPICWEVALAKYLCLQYNKYAADEANIIFSKKMIISKNIIGGQ